MGKGVKFLCIGISAAACLRSSSASDSIFGGFVKAAKKNDFQDIVAPPHANRSTAKDIIASRITETGNDKFVVSVAKTRHTNEPKVGYEEPVPEEVFSIQDDAAAAPATEAHGPAKQPKVPEAVYSVQDSFAPPAAETEPAKKPKFGHHEPVAEPEPVYSVQDSFAAPATDADVPAKKPKFGYQAPVPEPVYSVQDSFAPVTEDHGSEMPDFGGYPPLPEPETSIVTDRSSAKTGMYNARGAFGFDAPEPQFGIQNEAESAPAPVYEIDSNYPTPPPGQFPRPEPRVAFGHVAPMPDAVIQDEGAAAPATEALRPAKQPKFGREAPVPEAVNSVREKAAEANYNDDLFAALHNDHDASVDNAMINDAPVDEAMINDAPVDEAMINDAPVDEAMINDAPVDEAMINDAPVDEAMINDVSVDDAMINDAPVDEAMINDVSVDDAMISDASVDDAIVDEEDPMPEGEDVVDMGLEVPVYNLDNDGVAHMVSQDSNDFNASEKRAAVQTKDAKNIVSQRTQQVGATQKFSITLSKPARGAKEEHHQKKVAKAKKSAGSKKSFLRGSP